MSSMTVLDFQERLGLSFTVIAGSISIACVSGILVYALYKRLSGNERRYDASDSNIFLNLMVADLIQALGVMFNIKWVDSGFVTEGPVCTTQAVVKQIGINGVSFSSLAITIYTFVVLVLYWNPSRRSSWLAIFGIWLCIVLIVAIPNGIHRSRGEIYYGVAGFWCWIQSQYTVERLVTEYTWIWLTGITMSVLYSIMFVVMHGWIIIDNSIHWYRCYNRPVIAIPGLPDDQRARDTAKILLFYPAIYIFCFLPNTIARWLVFMGHDIPPKAILFANTIFASSGFFNFIIFYLTRRAMVIGAQVRGPDGELEIVPTNHHDEEFLPQGFPRNWEREPFVFNRFGGPEMVSSFQTNLSSDGALTKGLSDSNDDSLLQRTILTSNQYLPSTISSSPFTERHSTHTIRSHQDGELGNSLNSSHDTEYHTAPQSQNDHDDEGPGRLP